eukprot:m.658448 g.658448  ORF g.658448 m.658448 type:complete len:93 (-) comp22719_c0_seq6:288-566(-)
MEDSNDAHVSAHRIAPTHWALCRHCAQCDCDWVGQLWHMCTQGDRTTTTDDAGSAAASQAATLQSPWNSQQRTAIGKQPPGNSLSLVRSVCE